MPGTGFPPESVILMLMGASVARMVSLCASPDTRAMAAAAERAVAEKRSGEPATPSTEAATTYVPGTLPRVSTVET